MKMLNIMDIHRAMNERKNRMNECFDKVLERCHRKIVQCSQQQLLTCFYEVPEYMFGFPIYDLNECITYVMEALKSNGFLAHYYFPKYIYVSWNLEEIEQYKNAQAAIPSQTQVPALENKAIGNRGTNDKSDITKVLDFKYKPSGKLSVQL